MHHETLVSTEELAAHLDDPQWVVLDCQAHPTDTSAGARAYAKRHIPGSYHADLDSDMSSPVTPASGRHPMPDPERLSARLREWGVGRDTQVVVYDSANGIMACRMWWLLNWLGHSWVALLEGGLERWREEGREVTDAVPPPGAGDFEGRPDDSMWVGPEELERLLRADEALVVDARAPERYTGADEPVDKPPGHIPTSINLPMSDNLDDDGNLLPAAELHRRFAEVARRAPLVHSCASGVTACLNMLAMKAAGLPHGRLYPGSWSEWIRSPARAIATGEEPGAF